MTQEDNTRGGTPDDLVKAALEAIKDEKYSTCPDCLKKGVYWHTGSRDSDVLSTDTITCKYCGWGVLCIPYDLSDKAEMKRYEHVQVENFKKRQELPTKKQITRLWEDGKELTCQRCNVEHPPWSVTNEIWNRVIDDEKFLCPSCFIILAEQRGTFGIWRLTVEECGSLLRPSK